MRFLVAFSAVFALAAARPGYIGVPLGYVAPVSVLPLNQYHSQDTTGQYAFGYTSPVSAHAESRLGDVTSGSYSYIDPEGHVQTVTYRADATSGFRVAGTNVPQASAAPEASSQEPTPVQDTPEVSQAREEHLQAVEATRARDASAAAPEDNSAEQAQDAAQQAQDAAQQAQDAAQQAEDAMQQQRDNAQLTQDAMQQEQDNAQHAQDMAQQAQDQANEAQDQANEARDLANEQQAQAVEHAQTQTIVQLPYIYNYAPIHQLQYLQPYSYIQPAFYSYGLPFLYTNGHPVSDLPQDDAAVLRARAQHEAAHQEVRANLQAAGAAV